ncbi:hypothetical protein O181_014425 [Austropuccinia psidii MF-1]|uniref:Uncharacterized protein n=1 Tax=Austropuccinia psidii MF-1 TaxID=1389203 RepID=A0A9Q3C0X7_9BASI|nr:hypothetical protein [Austropuccinia psidii MF-1]
MPKTLAGGYELLLTHQEISGSGEDHRNLRRMESIVFQRKGQKEEELAEELKSFIHRPEERVGNDPSFGERWSSGVNQLQTSSRSVQRQAHRTSEEAERSKKHSRHGKMQSQLAQTLPTRVQDLQIGAFNHGQCIKYGQNSYGIHTQGVGKDEHDFSMRIMDEIKRIKSSIDVKLCKFDKELKKLTSYINELRNNDRTFTEWCKVKNGRLESISNTCDRIQRKNQLHNDELETHIYEKLTLLKTHVVEMVDNTNLFSTLLAKNDTERQELKNEIISHVEKIHKNISQINILTTILHL